MQIRLLDSILSPDWLKYGFTGLVAVFGILMYFIIKPLTQSESNKKFWIILFVGISFILLGTGGFYIYNNDKAGNVTNKTIDSLNFRIADLQEKLHIVNGTTPELQTLKTSAGNNKILVDSLTAINVTLAKSAQEQTDMLTGIVANSILESLENDWQVTSQKATIASGVKDLNFKRLRRVVFLNFLKFNADKNVLQQSLLALHKTNADVALADINKVLSNYNRLMQLKLSWLKSSAIPAVKNAFAATENNPMVQSTPAAFVKLPKDIWILDIDAEKDNLVTLTDAVMLEKEKTLLEQKLIASN